MCCIIKKSSFNSASLRYTRLKNTAWPILGVHGNASGQLKRATAYCGGQDLVGLLKKLSVSSDFPGKPCFFSRLLSSHLNRDFETATTQSVSSKCAGRMIKNSTKKTTLLKGYACFKFDTDNRLKLRGEQRLSLHI